jgi:hypothetical protein
VRPDANPYEAIGSGLDGDVLLAGRRAMAAEVERLMHFFSRAEGCASSNGGCANPPLLGLGRSRHLGWAT